MNGCSAAGRCRKASGLTDAEGGQKSEVRSPKSSYRTMSSESNTDAGADAEEVAVFLDRIMLISDI